MRSLSEAPKYASVIAKILKQDHPKASRSRQISNENISMQGIHPIDLILEVSNIAYK